MHKTLLLLHYLITKMLLYICIHYLQPIRWINYGKLPIRFVYFPGCENISLKIIINILPLICELLNVYRGPSCIIWKRSRVSFLTLPSSIHKCGPSPSSSFYLIIVEHWWTTFFPMFIYFIFHARSANFSYKHNG